MVGRLADVTVTVLALAPSLMGVVAEGGRRRHVGLPRLASSVPMTRSD